MAFLIFSPTASAVVGAVLILGYIVYRAGLPKPIPGIPYHKQSARRFFGDIPRLREHQKTSPTALDWMTSQAHEFDSPIFQLFFKPFCPPKVFLVDHRESTDILLRRSKEFDRSNFTGDLFAGIVPYHHIRRPTDDQFRAQRKLLGDTMFPGFLNEVAAKHIHQQVMYLIELWRIKSKLSGNRPFVVGDDISEMTLDAIWAVSFGSQIDTIKTQRDHLEKITKLELPAGRDQVADVPKPLLPASFEAIKTVSRTIEQIRASPFPVQHHWLIRQSSSYKRAQAAKDKLIQDRLDDAKARVLGTERHDNNIDCATDHMVLREHQAAEKEARQPQYDSPAAKDELFGFLVAGHDTTSTAVAWGVKNLSDSPAAQSKLRSALHAAYPEHHNNGTVPTVANITKTDVVYLDAVVEEVLRLAPPIPTTIRRAICDTEVLGHKIPKGTDIFMMINGPGYIQEDTFARNIPESVRSQSSRGAKGKIPDWPVADMGVFKPERWLKSDAKGANSFDSKAGPARPFGAGVRGCFGKKMAYLELKIIFTLMIWSFELPQLPEELSSYKAWDRVTHIPLQCYARPRYLLGEDSA